MGGEPYKALKPSRRACLCIKVYETNRLRIYVRIYVCVRAPTRTHTNTAGGSDIAKNICICTNTHTLIYTHGAGCGLR
jgi:hypothetical protein